MAGVRPRVVFDLDGTLVDSVGDIHAAVNAELAARGKGPLSVAQVTSFVGNGLPHLTGLVIEAVGLDHALHADMTASLLARYEAQNHVHSSPYPGVRKTLDVLRSQGASLAVCTNKPEGPARALLDALQLGPFEAVVGGDTLAQRKPDPAPLQHVLAAMPDGPAVYVGDSEVDAETAARADVPFLLFTEGYRKGPAEAMQAAALFDDFANLPQLVARIG